MIWFFCTLLAGAPSPAARVELGVQESHFMVQVAQDPFSFPDYRNNGYLQKVVPSDKGQRVVVRVKNTQLASKMRARKVKLPAEFAALQKHLDETSSGRLADQVSILVQWLRHEIENETTPLPDQSPVAVMARRSANCVGLADLMLYVLKEMGVDARYVTGIAFKEGDEPSLHLAGDVLHRWIEIRYEDVGWVFCDPAGKVNFVDSTYVVLGVQNLHPLPRLLEQAVDSKVRWLRFSNGFRTVGTLDALGQGVRVRPNRLMIHP